MKQPGGLRDSFHSRMWRLLRGFGLGRPLTARGDSARPGPGWR